MLLYIQYSYYIIISLLFIYILITLYLGDNLDSSDIALYIALMLISPIILLSLIPILIFILLLYILNPIQIITKKLKIHIPKLSNVELKTKKQIQAELILANYKKEYYINKKPVYKKEDIYIVLDTLSILISYKTESQTLLLFSSARMNQAIVNIKNNFIPKKE